MSTITKTTTIKTLQHCCFAFLLLGSQLGTAQAQQDLTNQITVLAESSHRSEEHKARNTARNPAETLQFFGLRNDMSVLEIWPGHGWYTEILAPLLKDNGQLTLAQFRSDDGSLRGERNKFWARVSAKLAQRIADNSDYFGDVAYLELDPPLLYPQPVEAFDMIVSFRNAHIWNEEGHLAATLQSLFHALKPGGILGMVEHRAARLSDISSSAVAGYLDESYVINAAQNAGFELVATSEVNANPADTKDYPKGVYALPPTLAMGDKNKAFYMSIGESDRMTLKFTKPHE